MHSSSAHFVTMLSPHLRDVQGSDQVVSMLADLPSPFPEKASLSREKQGNDSDFFLGKTRQFMKKSGHL